MFCPDGFICLCDLLPKVRTAVFLGLESGTLTIDNLEKLRGTSEPTRRSIFLYQDHPWMIYDIWADEAVLRFLVHQSSDFWIMPPSGKGDMLRLSPRAFAADLAPYEINVSDKAKKIPVEYNGPSGYDELHDREDRGESIVVQNEDPFFFIDCINGVIQVPYISDSPSDFVLYAAEANILSNVAGWIICWKLPDVPLTDDYLIQKAFDGKADDGADASPSRRGPRHQHERVWAKFCEHYPSGDKGSDTWEVVQSATGLSRSVIYRAIEWAAKNRAVQVKPDTNLIPF